MIQASTLSPSTDLVEDACMNAWRIFLHRQPDRELPWRRWLVLTAQREMWRIARRERGHSSLDEPALHESDVELAERLADPTDVLEQRRDLREALDALAQVPARRRQVKALQATGYTYAEIGERLGLSYTRVNTLAAEANRRLRREREVAESGVIAMSERAARLDALEREPPTWLTSAIGRRPAGREPIANLLEWRRAALALDDYRRLQGWRGEEPFGQRPTDPVRARAFDLATTAVERTRGARKLDRTLDR